VPTHTVAGPHRCTVSLSIPSHRPISQVFSRFLDGDSLESCYAAVAEVANNWLDVVDTRGEALDDAELIGLISENKTISGLVADYGDQKITSLTTAARLGDYLGGEMLQDKGLNCRLVIANRPYGAPVTDRAIPTVIFKAEPVEQQFWLRKWLKTTASVELRDVVSEAPRCGLGSVAAAV